MNENAYRVRAERGEVQIGTWVNMIRTPAVLTLLRAAGLDFARVCWTSTGAGWWRRRASTAKRWRC
jgi:hypothetical protein